MSSIFTSDLHIGHKSICKYRDKFNNSKEHDRYMLDKIKELDKRDTLTILGDFVFDGDSYQEYIDEIQTYSCTIKLVMGNHDSKLLYSLPNSSNIKVQLPLYSYKKLWLSHCPIHPNELRGRNGNIHGHLHKETLDDSRYFNVNIDVNNYEFVELDTIKEYFNGRDEIIT